MPQEMISVTWHVGLLSPSHVLSHTLNAACVVKDLHSDCMKTILPTVSEAKITICKLFKMSFIHLLLSQALCQPHVLEML